MIQRMGGPSLGRNQLRLERATETTLGTTLMKIETRSDLRKESKKSLSIGRKRWQKRKVQVRNCL